ncbi:hypothetical protein CFOL_v3_33036, partial [Cephalotus follicularis]
HHLCLQIVTLSLYPHSLVSISVSRVQHQRSTAMSSPPPLISLSTAPLLLSSPLLSSVLSLSTQYLQSPISSHFKRLLSSHFERLQRTVDRDYTVSLPPLG